MKAWAIHIKNTGKSLYYTLLKMEISISYIPRKATERS